jgi:hypothetical protein
MAQGSLEVSATSIGANQEPFRAVPTKDINGRIFKQTVRFIAPLDHLLR